MTIPFVRRSRKRDLFNQSNCCADGCMDIDTGNWDGWYMGVGGPAFGFGWGMNQGNGAPGKMYAWGAIYGTVGGKITGLTVLAPQAGF